MDDPGSLGTLLSIRIHMAHNVMAYFLLSGFGYIVIDIIRMCLHLIDLLLGNDRPAILGQS